MTDEIALRCLLWLGSSVLGLCVAFPWAGAEDDWAAALVVLLAGGWAVAMACVVG